MSAFDLRGPLPTGTTLLEASAGTGKTLPIAALVTRYVAEGVAHARRDAGRHLRPRGQPGAARAGARASSCEAERALADPAAADRRPSGLRRTAARRRRRRAWRRRRQRLRDALAAFDAATIATTHQFCQLVLRSPRRRRRHRRRRARWSRTSTTWSSRWSTTSTCARFAPAAERAAVRPRRGAGARPHRGRRPAGPAGAGRATTAATAGRAPGRVRATRCAPRSTGASAGSASCATTTCSAGSPTRSTDDDAPARERMRQRWRVVLVDEFQDTDPVQWQVLDRAFTGHATMVLIGDPKQAIYAFRGGDVVTYLAAAAHRDHPADARPPTGAATPPLRRRAPGGARAAPRSATRGSSCATWQRPPRRAAGWSGRRARRRSGCGCVRRDAASASAATEPLTVGDVRAARRRATCAADIARLLASRRDVRRPSRCEPRDVAVLVPPRRPARWSQQALAAVGVPAVVAGGGSVFAHPGRRRVAARCSRRWSSRTAPRRVRAAALTLLLRAHRRRARRRRRRPHRPSSPTPLRGWAGCSARRGGRGGARGRRVSAGCPPGCSADVDGERLLTDLRHSAQALHEVAPRERLGLVALLTWLRAQVAEDAVDGRRRAHPPARLRRRRGAARHDPRQQGPGVPRRLPALRSATATSPKPDGAAASTTTTGARCLDVGGGGAELERPRRRRRRARRPARSCGCSTSRSPAPSPRSSPGGRRRQQHPGVGRCTGCCSGGRRGRPTVPEQVRGAERRRGRGAVLGRWQDARRARARGGACPPTAGADPAARTTGRSPCAASPARVDTDWRRTSYSALSAAAEARRPPAGASAASPRCAGKDDEAGGRAPRTPAAGEPPTRAGRRAVADGRPAGRRDVRLAGARGPRARRPGRRRPARRAARPRRRAARAGGRSTSTAEALADALVPVLRHPARAAGRRR